MIYVFTGCDSTSRVFVIGKKTWFQQITKKENKIKESSKVFCLPKQSQNVVKTSGCRAMVALLNANQNDSQASIRYNILCKIVARAKVYVMYERVPLTSRACKFISLRAYYQVMEWIGRSDEVEPSEWGWRVEGEKCIPGMKYKSSVPDVILQMNHCDCSGSSEVSKTSVPLIRSLMTSLMMCHHCKCEIHSRKYCYLKNIGKKYICSTIRFAI